MYNLNEVVRGATMCLSKAGLKIGNGDVKDFDIAAPNGAGIDFSINGVLYHVADCQDQPLTAATAQVALSSCIYLICASTAGALTSVKGTDCLAADLAAGTQVLRIPDPTAGTCPIGYIRVDTGAATTFTAGTTNLNAALITDTYVDLCMLPDPPFLTA